MTRQEAFDKAVRGLASQNWELSMSDPDPGAVHNAGAVCAYRGVGGRRCAIGWLISDKEYFAGMEGESVRSVKLRDVKALERPHTERKDTWVNFLLDLQHVHDDSGSPDAVKQRMRAFANKYNLTWPEGG